MANDAKFLKSDNGLLDLPLESITVHWPSAGMRAWKLSKEVIDLRLLHYDPSRETSFVKATLKDNTVQYGLITAARTDINFLPLQSGDPRQADIEAFIREYKRRY